MLGLHPPGRLTWVIIYGVYTFKQTHKRWKRSRFNLFHKYGHFVTRVFISGFHNVSSPRTTSLALFEVDLLKSG